jgi:Zn-dependent protease
MFLGGEQPTPLDLRFRLFRFPVTITPWFWLITLLFGDVIFRVYGVAVFLIWVGCVTVSILVHELGHAFAYRAFGSQSSIQLNGFGGLAFGHPPSSPWKRMAISLAGPFIQFALAGVVIASQLAFRWATDDNVYTAKLFDFLLWVNIVWAAINLLPILPLDGGNVCREALVIARVRNPDAGAAAVSVALAGLLALSAIAAYLRLDVPVLRQIANVYTPSVFMTFWLCLLVYQNYQLYQAAGRRYTRYYDDDSDTPPWRR